MAAPAKFTAPIVVGVCPACKADLGGQASYEMTPQIGDDGKVTASDGKITGVHVSPHNCIPAVTRPRARGSAPTPAPESPAPGATTTR